MSQLIITLLAVINIALSGTSFAVDTKWAKFQSFGLGIAKENKTYPIVTFIPPLFLLFNVDKSSTTIQNNKYKKVRTQDGVELYMLEGNLSKGGINKLGKAVIFNQGKTICKIETGCNKENIDEVLEIHDGEFFRKSEEGDKIKLRGTRTRTYDEISGVISKNDLEEWNKKGIVTFADKTQPRLKFTRKDSKAFNLKCGESRAEGQERSIEMTEADKIINKIFELVYVANDSKDPSVKYQKNYGKEDRSYKFRTYTVEDNWGGNLDKVYAAEVIYECTKRKEGVDPPRLKRIVSVTLRDEESNTEEGASIELEPWGTPENLKEFTGTPHYLYSVNNDKQYFGLMSVLSKKFKNRAESGYFLAEFNRSCNSSNRTTQSECKDHKYEDKEKDKDKDKDKDKKKDKDKDKEKSK